jgi:hypothetical protein
MCQHFDIAHTPTPPQSTRTSNKRSLTLCVTHQPSSASSPTGKESSCVRICVSISTTRTAQPVTSKL